MAGYLPVREFNANEGDRSTLSAGPDAIERDLDKLMKMFNPALTHDDNTPGGIGAENIQNGAVGDVALGNLQIDSHISTPFNGLDKLTVVLSYITKILCGIKGYPGDNIWFTDPDTSLYELKSQLQTLESTVLLKCADYDEIVDTTSWDAPAGLYTTIRYNRTSDSTLYLQCVLSNKVDGNYLTDTWTIYAADGVTLVRTIVWSLTYENGIIVAKNPEEV